MDERQIRLACLKLARPDQVVNPDAQQIMERAQAFYDFVVKATETPADKALAPAQKPVARPTRS